MDNRCHRMGEHDACPSSGHLASVEPALHFVPFKRVGGKRLLRMVDGLRDVAARHRMRSLSALEELKRSIDREFSGAV